ncbi:MAG: N-acetyltransferase [Paenibacillus sp.]|jgi:ribosomal protein S18 acetylase RimI-like enzyme|nr:N-acetyltransferase [Paenibacillus sp.]
MLRIKPIESAEQATQEVVAVLCECLYKPDQAKLERILKAYVTDPACLLYRFEETESKKVCAVIGIRLQPERHTAVILHIAVKQGYRGRDLGRSMMNEVIGRHCLHFLEAETDKDAVGFYRACGFEVTSLGEKYPGVERFLCVKIITE